MNMAEMRPRNFDYITEKTKDFFQDKVDSFVVDRFMDSPWPEFSFTFVHIKV